MFSDPAKVFSSLKLGFYTCQTLFKNKTQKTIYF